MASIPSYFSASACTSNSATDMESTVDNNTGELIRMLCLSNSSYPPLAVAYCMNPIHVY